MTQRLITCPFYMIEIMPSAQWLSNLNWQDFEKLAIRVAEAEGYQGIQREGGSSGGPDAIYLDDDSTVYFEFTTDERREKKIIEDIEKVHTKYICQENNFQDSIEKLVIIITEQIDKEYVQNCPEAISAPFEIDIYDIDDIIKAIDTLSEWFKSQRIDQIARFDSDPASPFQSMSDNRFVVIDNPKIHHNFDVPTEFQFDVYISNRAMQEFLTNTGPELFNRLLYLVSDENYEILYREVSQEDPYDHIVCYVHGPDEYIPVVRINGGRTKLFIDSFIEQNP